jgi:thiol-disulfide isomerase/thioredoxin
MVMQSASDISPNAVAPAGRFENWRFTIIIILLSVGVGWGLRRWKVRETEVAAPDEPRMSESIPLRPVLRSGTTPAEEQLAALGFEIGRDPVAAPRLTVENDAGWSLSLTDLQGSWVLVEFWGVSCEPCRKAMPALHRLSESTIGEQLKCVPVCVDADDAATAQAHLSRIAPGMLAYVEPTGIGLAQFGVQALPMTWLIDPNGSVRATRVGSIDWDSKDVRKTLEAVVRSPKSK